jgi:tetratricopeptide (TPR) repeat protein
LATTRDAERSHLDFRPPAVITIDSPAQRAYALLGQGRAKDALALTAPFAASPNADSAVLDAHAAVLKALNRHTDAVEFNARAARAAPRNGVIWHNYAATLGDLDRWPEALAAVNRAFGCGLAAPETWLVKARALQNTGDLSGAESAFRQAIRRRPTYAEAHRDYAQFLWMKSGDAELSTQPLRQIAAAHPDDAALGIVLANVYEVSGRPQAAYDELRARLARAPGDVRLLLAASHVAALVGDDAAALAHAEAAHARAPDAGASLEALCTACLAVGDAPRALELARRRLAQDPQGQMALAAARLAGDPQHDRIYDFNAFVRADRIDAPEGWSDLASYLADLKLALDRLHVFKAHPLDQSLRGGSQTTQPLLQLDDPAIKAFFRAVDRPIRDYMNAVGTGNDPLRARITGAYRIRGAWSVRLRATDYHIDHIHPQGWLSSAFYVETPSAVDRGHEGWLALGRPAFRTRPALEPERWERPEPGKLVLFPSYLWHGTAPFSSDETRMSLAFDVIPA